MPANSFGPFSTVPSGMGYNQADPVRLPAGNQTLPNGQRYFGADNYGSGANRPPSPFDMAGTGTQRPTGPQQSGGSIGGGMGYAGSGPGGSFSPAQLPGGLLGVGAQQQPSRAMQVYGSSPVAGMDNRTFQMMARYLPNSGTGVDPVASPGTVRNRYGGDWTKMIPQNLQGKFQQFQDAMGGMTDYNQFRAYQGRPEINYGGQGTRWNPWNGSRTPPNPAPIATAMQGQMGSMGAAAPAAPGAPAAAGAPVVNALMRNRTTTPNNTY